jgi:hypothetical protein
VNRSRRKYGKAQSHRIALLAVGRIIDAHEAGQLSGAEAMAETLEIARELDRVHRHKARFDPKFLGGDDLVRLGARQ